MRAAFLFFIFSLILVAVSLYGRKQGWPFFADPTRTDNAALQAVSGEADCADTLSETSIAKLTPLPDSLAKFVNTYFAKEIQKDSIANNIINDYEFTGPLANLYQALAPQTKFFLVENPNEPAIISSPDNEGLTLVIPDDAFITQDKKMVQSPFVAAIKLVSNKTQLLTSNLSRPANMQPMQFAGAVYISAALLENGQELTLAPGKSILIEVTTPQTPTGCVFYYGKPGINGNFDWGNTNYATHNELIAIAPNLIPLPDDTTAATPSLPADLLHKLRRNGWKNTHIATREFGYRIQTAATLNTQTQQYLPDIVNIYMAEKSLADADYKVSRFFNRIRKNNPNLSQENDELCYKAAETFAHFAQQNLSAPFDPKPYGIDLNSPTALTDLLWTTSLERAQFYTNAHLLKKAVAVQMIENQALKTGRQSFTHICYSTYKRGWTGLFCPIEPPYDPVTVQIKPNETFKQIAVYFIADDVELVMARHLQGKNKNTVVFNQIPANTSGKIIALSWSNGQAYMSTKRAKAGQPSGEAMQLQPTTIDMVRYQINKPL